MLKSKIEKLDNRLSKYQDIINSYEELHSDIDKFKKETNVESIKSDLNDIKTKLSSYKLRADENNLYFKDSAIITLGRSISYHILYKKDNNNRIEIKYFTKDAREKERLATYESLKPFTIIGIDTQ